MNNAGEREAGMVQNRTGAGERLTPGSAAWIVTWARARHPYNAAAKRTGIKSEVAWWEWCARFWGAGRSGTATRLRQAAQAIREGLVE